MLQNDPKRIAYGPTLPSFPEVDSPRNANPRTNLRKPDLALRWPVWTLPAEFLEDVHTAAARGRYEDLWDLNVPN